MRLLFVFTFLVLLSAVQATSVVYDDFSSPLLNTTKWTESTDLESWPLFDEHAVTSELRYHTAQLAPDNRVILLTSNRVFVPGESLTYKTYVQSMSGNILSRPTINGIPLDLLAGSSCAGYSTCADIGYWNGVSEAGDAPGLYVVSIAFSNGTINLTFTNPLSQTFTRTLGPVIPPFTFGVASRTGHDGVGHIDYDDFVITQPDPPKADLTISSITTINCVRERRYPGIRFSITVQNSGGSLSPRTNVDLYYDRSAYSFEVNELPAGSSKTVESACITSERKYSYAAAIIDPLDRIVELSEENNAKTVFVIR
jgi:hypothetical protein